MVSSLRCRGHFDQAGADGLPEFPDLFEGGFFGLLGGGDDTGRVDKQVFAGGIQAASLRARHGVGADKTAAEDFLQFADYRSLDAAGVCDGGGSRKV